MLSKAGVSPESSLLPFLMTESLCDSLGSLRERLPPGPSGLPAELISAAQQGLGGRRAEREVSFQERKDIGLSDLKVNPVPSYCHY